jgi:hypothetical protein
MRKHNIPVTRENYIETCGVGQLKIAKTLGICTNVVQCVPVAERALFSSWVFLTSLSRAKDRYSPFGSML